MAIYSGPEIPNSGLVFNLDAANPKNFGLTAVQVLVVAGGGGGGADVGGGGGGGGVIYNPNFSVTPGTAYTVTVGGGGARGQIFNEGAQGYGYNGGNSVFGSLTAIGGGGGGNYNSNTAQVGGSGGGGGGAGSAAAAGTAGQGNSGGSGSSAAYGSGGGGGAGSPGQSVTGIVGGSGGNGLAFDISGTATFYGGGGGGGGGNDSSSDGRGYGGLGGGGTGSARSGTFATLADNVKNGAPNTGGGGGGTGGWNSAGAGGSGIVIVRYPGPQRAIGGTVTRVGNDTVHTFTSVGSTTFTPLATGTLSGLADQTNLNGFAVATNTPTYNSSNNGSVVFNGSNNYLSAGALSGSFTSFTVFIWFYPNSVANYQNPIDCNYSYNGTTGNIGPRLEMDSTGNLGWTYSNITNSNASYYGHSVVASGLAANTWHCAAITFNSTTSTTYYNGVATGLSRTAVGSPTGFIGVMNNINFGRGFHLGGAERYFSGRVGMTQIYNRALSAAEVAQLFESSRGRYGV